MVVKWFMSRSVRQTAEMSRQMKRILNEQRDLLSAEGVAAINAARREALDTIRTNPTKQALKDQMKKMELAAQKWFKPYWQPAVRENIKELIVAITTILAFTTFFLQLTKIPTGSMQPTLFGITFTDLRENDFTMPSLAQRLALYWTQGVSYKELIAPADGSVTDIEPLKTVFPFVKKQRIKFNNQWLTVWLAPERFDEHLKGALNPARHYKKGEPIIRLKVVAGDHLLVDRITYNFRRPERGEIFVFKTRGIPMLNQDQLYIKRLVGMPNEEIRISNDGHLIVNGNKLDASDRHFESVYTFSPTNQVEHPYYGHANEARARGLGYVGPLAPLFQDENDVFKIRPNHYLAMGDNTLNSLDSRAWGDVHQKNVIGKCWFVYWPFTDRFGWSYR